MSFRFEESSSPQPQQASITPQQEPDRSNISFDEGDDGDLLYRPSRNVERDDDGDDEDLDLIGGSEDEGEELPEDEDDLSIDSILKQFEEANKPQPPPVSTPSSPAPAETPPDFDEKFLSPDHVENIKLQLRSHFEAAINNEAVSKQQLANTAYTTASELARMKMEYARVVSAAYNLYQQFTEVQRQNEPLRRIATARAIAKVHGVSDYKKLLKHPRTGKLITDGAEMESIASIIGEKDRTRRVNSEKKVSRGVSSSGRSQGKRIKDMDVDGKDFEALERAVKSGKRIRLVS